MSRLKRLTVEAHQRSLWQALVVYLTRQSASRCQRTIRCSAAWCRYLDGLGAVEELQSKWLADGSWVATLPQLIRLALPARTPEICVGKAYCSRIFQTRIGPRCVPLS
jgi:hypothetical protein